MLGYAVLAFFLASMPVCFIRPFYGILLWMVVAFLNPQSVMWAFEFPLAVAVGIPTLIGLLIFETGWAQRLRSREAFLMAVLGLWFTVTTLISTSTPAFVHHAEDTWLKWNMVSKILLMTWAAIAVVRTFQQLRLLVLVIASCFTFFVLKSIPFVIATRGGERLYGPPNSMIGDNNDFGLALVMTLPIFFFLLRSETVPWIKRLCVFMFFVTIPAIFLTYSRGALLGLVTVIALMLGRLKQRILLILVMVMASLIVVVFAPDRWKQRMDPGGEVIDSSAQSRFNSWTFCWRLALDYPIAGGGFATFTPELFDRYAPQSLDVHNSHSIYFGVLAEHGFVGLLLFGAVMCSSFATTRRLIKLARVYEDDRAIAYANMFRFSIVGFMVSGAFLSRTYFDYFYAIVACIAILNRICLAEWKSMDEQACEVEEMVT